MSRAAKETNWGHWRMAEREDFPARRKMVMVDVDLRNGFDPTINPALLGITIVPDRKPIRRGRVYFHSPPSGVQHVQELTVALGKKPSNVRFWIEC